MKRLTRKDDLFLGGYELLCNFADAFSKLGKIEDLMEQCAIEDTGTLKVAVFTALQTIAIEDEIGCEFVVVFNAIKNGIYDKEGKFHKQVYLCFVDDEWTIADMQTDCWYLISEYGKTCSLFKPASLTNLQVVAHACSVSVGKPYIR